MKIRQYINDSGEFCAEITSPRPIFVNYDQINAMSLHHGFRDQIDLYLNMEDCPTSINEGSGINLENSEGIWFYDRLTDFIGWDQDDIDRSIMRKALMSSEFKA